MGLEEIRPTRVLLTGATSGIGLESARQLIRRGADVIIHGRSATKVAETVEELGAEHEGVVADFSSLEAVREMAAQIEERFDVLDVLVNNAGTYELERRVTGDGYELTFQVNHLAPFLLTNLLTPLLKASAPSRVVTVSSGAHVRGEIEFDDLMNESDYDAYNAYADSKLANVLFCYALARRLEGTGVTSNCMDPQATDTRMLHIAHPDYDGRPVSEAATDVVCAALEPVGAERTGVYLRECQPRHSARVTYDTELQDRLWKVSAELTRSP